MLVWRSSNDIRHLNLASLDVSLCVYNYVSELLLNAFWSANFD